jgi:hypothetical protein
VGAAPRLTLLALALLLNGCGEDERPPAQPAPATPAPAGVQADACGAEVRVGDAFIAATTPQWRVREGGRTLLFARFQLPQGEAAPDPLAGVDVDPDIAAMYGVPVVLEPVGGRWVARVFEQLQGGWAQAGSGPGGFVYGLEQTGVGGPPPDFTIAYSSPGQPWRCLEAGDANTLVASGLHMDDEGRALVVSETVEGYEVASDLHDRLRWQNGRLVELADTAPTNWTSVAPDRIVRAENVEGRTLRALMAEP